MTSNETPKAGAGGLVAGGAAFSVVLAVLGWWMWQGEAPVDGGSPVTETASLPTTVQEDVDTTPVQDVAPLTAPRFDVVRVEPDGSSVIAGQAAPGSNVELLVDGAPVSSTQADANGNFVALLTLAPSDTPRVMSLMVDGQELQTSAQSVIVGPTTTEQEVAVVDAETVTPSTELTAEATEATEATEVDQSPVPQSPQVLLADDAGITVLQDASGAIAVADISLDSISYDERGAVALAGRGTPSEVLHVYLDNDQVADGSIAKNGQWRLTLSDVTPGIYTLRIEALDASGALSSRVETPFKREDPAQLVALSEEANGTAEGVATSEMAASNPVPASQATDVTNDTDVAADVVAETEENASDVVASGPATDAATVTASTTSTNVVGTEENANDAVTDVAENVATIAMETAPNVVATPEIAPAISGEVDHGEVVLDGQTTVSQSTLETAAKPSRPRVITVQAGATLWAIARQNLGEGTLYVQVFDANRDKISNPDLIYPGQVFSVPDTQ